MPAFIRLQICIFMSPRSTVNSPSRAARHLPPPLNLCCGKCNERVLIMTVECDMTGTASIREMVGPSRMLMSYTTRK